MSYVDFMSGVIVADWWDLWTPEEYESLTRNMYEEFDKEEVDFVENADKYILETMNDVYNKVYFYEDYGISIVKVEIVEILNVNSEQHMFNNNSHVKAKVKINGIFGILKIDSYYEAATRMEPEDYDIEITFEKLK